MTWDEYFMEIAKSVGAKSHCLSRHIGAIAVRGGKHIIATGFNGPPSGYPHCVPVCNSFTSQCPRRATGYGSGEGLDICPAAHAERNVISEAARIGVCLQDCVIYLNFSIPCRECAKSIVNAGIREVVVDSLEVYPEAGIKGIDILSKCDVTVRGTRNVLEEV
jgi:dCMP deaminase